MSLNFSHTNRAVVMVHRVAMRSCEGIVSGMLKTVSMETEGSAFCWNETNDAYTLHTSFRYILHFHFISQHNCADFFSENRLNYVAGNQLKFHILRVKRFVAKLWRLIC